MIQLPNDCHMGKISVNPSNYKVCGREALSKKWYFEYRFYDPEFREIEKYKYGMKCIRKLTINDFKTLKDRREAMTALIDYEIAKLKKGWHPIRKKLIPQRARFEYEIDPTTLFIPAMEKALDKMKANNNKYIDIKSILKYTNKAIMQLKFDSLEIQQVRRRHCKVILEHLAFVKGKSWTNNNYNHYKRYLSVVFNELLECEAVDFNPFRDIRKKPVIEKVREILTDKEFVKVSGYLADFYPEFWRYAQIFLYSGKRTTELLKIQVKDVDLGQQRFKYVQKKGNRYKEKMGVINNNAVHLWTELLEESFSPDDYLFSDGLAPGPLPIDPKQITKRWNKHVKKKLGIKKDFYSLKHTYLDAVSNALTLSHAKAVAGHTSLHTTKIYTVGLESRINNELQNIDIKFIQEEKL